MRVICPNCDAQYEVAEDAIPAEGRDVQCSNCGHAWFQPHPVIEAETEEPEPPFGPAPATMTPAPGPDDLPEPEPEPEPEPAPPVPPPVAPRRRVDDSVLSVLREEAAFEARARARDVPRPLETQGELGLDNLPPVAVTPAAQARAAQKDIEAEPAEPASRAPKGRDLLPDIEEINSTLRPVPPTEAGGAAGGRAAAPAAGSRRSFGAGFGLALLLGLVLAVAYLLAPRLAAQVPALSAPLTAYAAAVDAARLALDGAIQQVIGLIQG